ncbi:methionyl-tRNA formyltransferase [soil metagenome]
MRVVFAGTPAPALPSLRALLDSRHDVVAVVTRPEARAGRGRRHTVSPVTELAHERAIEVLAPDHPGDEKFLARLRTLRPDCCPVVAYGALLPQRVLEVPTHGWVNLHFSVLPAWRGAAPVQHALLHGDEITGATTFRIVRELDAGPTLGLVTESIRATDTAGTLLDRLATSGAGLLVDTLDHLEAGDLHADEQPRDGVTYAPKIEVQDARVRWADPAFGVDRRVRACTPDPGAWSVLADNRFKVGPVTARPEVDDLTPGAVRVEPREVLVGTGTHAVALGWLQPPGKKPMPATDWARGARREQDARFVGGT